MASKKFSCAQFEMNSLMNQNQLGKVKHEQCSNDPGLNSNVKSPLLWVIAFFFSIQIVDVLWFRYLLPDLLFYFPITNAAGKHKLFRAKPVALTLLP